MRNPFRRKPVTVRDERKAAIVAHAEEIERWIEEMERYAPCRNPDCQTFRHEIAAIVNNTKQVHGA